MAIVGLSKEEFGVRLSRVVSPSHPIRTIEHLQGREGELEIIARALFAGGRQIFIFGDRGVGKSSLAATAAFQYQSSDASPIFVSGSPDDTFRTIIANIAAVASRRSRTETKKIRRSAGFTWRGLKFGVDTEVSSLDISAQLKTIGDAAEILKHVIVMHSQKPIVVIDEFDAIPEESERIKFASLVKMLGDQSVDLKFIFTGIARGLDELLGAHPSAHRQFEARELTRLSWEGRRQILDTAADAFGLIVDNDVNWRVAIISDGYPYYVHLIAEKMLWEAFAEEEEVKVLGWTHFQRGLIMAIESINAELKRPYEKAVSHRESHFEDVVWSTADGEDLYRSNNDLYDSYSVIIEKRPDRTKLDAASYLGCIRKLKSASYGSILEQIPHRRGWYMYREKMLRGYVRMQAEVNGVELSGERPMPRQMVHVPMNARTGYRGPSLPPGVKANKPIR